MEKPSFEYVYFIRAQGTNLIKIGRTTSLQDRLNTLQTGCPHQLELIIAVAHPDSPSIEKRLHQKFERYGTTGEWFALSEADRSSKAPFSPRAAAASPQPPARRPRAARPCGAAAGRQGADFAASARKVQRARGSIPATYKPLPSPLGVDG